MFHKQVGLHDAGGDGIDIGDGGRTLGTIQQVQSPPEGLIRARLPFNVNGWVPRLVKRTTGLLALAEDDPRADNRVSIDRSRIDASACPSSS